MSRNRRTTPTHDELGLWLIKKWDGKVKFFYGAWHVYETSETGGVWRPRTESEVMLDLWNVQIQHKSVGIDPSQGRCGSIESFCRAHLTIPPDKLKNSDRYINLANGNYEIRTGVLASHDPDLYLTHQMPFHFSSTAKCPQWLAFVRSVLVKPDGSPDEQLINLFQEMCYYCLTAEIHHRAAFFLVGPKGSGKSTLVNLLIAVAGDSHVSVNLEELNNPYTLASIAGRRLVTFSEPDTRVPLADGTFKKVVSKDPVPARAIYGIPFSFVPKCKLVGSMNALPKVLDRSGAVFDRIVIIPVIRAVPKEQRDLYLEERLKQELPGIFNWMMDGAGRLKMQGRFTVPEQTEAAVKEYEYENDIPRQWLEEAAEINPSAVSTLDNLHGSFQQWSQNSGYQGMGKITFRRELNRMGFQHTKNGVTKILGVRLKERGMF